MKRETRDHKGIKVIKVIEVILVLKAHQVCLDFQI